MAIKILVIDDEPNLEPLMRQIFRQIRKNLLDFTFALDGEQALHIIRQDKTIDIILTDINMPKMDGLTLLTRLKEMHSELNPVLTSIIISAYGDMDNIRRAMNNGAFDFLIKPLDYADLRVTIEKTVEHVRSLKMTLASEQLAREALHEANRELEQQVKDRTVELEEANESLQISNAELDAFARTVAHDLKNPLASIVSIVNLIVSDYSDLQDKEIIELVEMMGQSAQNGLGIIDELLLLARTRQEDVQTHPLDMNLVVHKSLNRLKWMVDSHKATIDLPQQWFIPVGHAAWVEEVWANYLSNGIKYGGTPPYLKVGAELNDDGFIKYWVHDNGVGIKPEDQKILFTEFTQLGNGSVEGTGLGLSIVRRIIEKLGGTVGIESAIGQGSTFYFTLPTIAIS